MRKNKTRVIVIDAMLIAMYTVLSLFDIKIGNAFKFSLSTLPIVTGGMLFGPMHGMVIGLLGSFINQMITYGFMATTILYVIPYALCGFAAGLVAKAFEYQYTRKSVAVTAIVTTMVLTATTTVSLYIASHIEGWYSVQVVFGSLITKCVKNVFLTAAYMLLLPPILKEAVKVIGVQKSGENSQ